MRLATALALATLLTLSLGIRPPSLEAQWPIEEFEVVGVEPAGVSINPNIIHGDWRGYFIRFLRIVGVDPDDVQAVELPDSTSERIEAHLRHSARQLAEWGFPPPALEPVVTTDDGREAYRVYVVRGIDGASGKYHPARCYEANETVIVLDADEVLAGGNGIVTTEGLSTTGHELFHAVQSSMPFNEDEGCRGLAGHWIVEGQAEAVGWDLVRSAGVDMTRFLSNAAGLRKYARRLPVPRRSTNRFQIEDPAYETASFWRYLAEMHAGSGTPGPEPGPVDYGYLVQLLGTGPVPRDCSSAGAPCTAEIRWLDQGVQRLFRKPLREVYANFVDALSMYGEHRFAGDPTVPDDPGLYWRTSVLDCYPIELHASPDSASFTESIDEFEPVSSTCFPVTPVGFRGDVTVAVTVDGTPDAWTISNLSAAVGGRPIRADTAEIERDPNTGNLSATWLFEMPTDDTTYVLLTNVARDAAATLPMRNLPVTFTALDEYAFLGTSAGASGPSAAEIDAPLPIELDLVRQAVLTGNQNENHIRMGHHDVCSLQFAFLNTATQDALGIRMDHEGPVVPGTYPIYNDSENRGIRFDYIEENPGVALVTFGLGRNNPATGGAAWGYVGKGGSLILERVTPYLVQGRIQVTGEKNCSVSSNDECPGPEGAAAEAVFSVRPTGVPSSRAPLRECVETHPSVATAAPGDSPSPGAPPDETPPPERGVDPSLPTPGSPVTQPGTDPTPADEAVDPLAPPDSATAQTAVSADAFGHVNRFWLSASGSVDTTVVALGDQITLTGGCDGAGPMSIGFHSGQPQSSEWLSFAFDTEGVVGTGATGEFAIEEVRWDNGTVIPPNLHPGVNVRVPDRFTGTGTLRLSTHSAALGGPRRMAGTVETASMANGEGASAVVVVEFDVNLSCGVEG